MKYILAILALFTVFSFAAPTTAKADHYCNKRVVSYLPCGRPVYAYYQVIGYDRCGQPVGRWVTQYSSCSCSVCRPRISSHHHNHHNSCGRSGIAISGGGLSFFFGR